MPGPYANTTGIILPKTQSAPAGNNTNPSGGAETEAEQDWWQRWGSDTLHGILDVAGLVPVLGEGADLINAGIYLAEGDKINASLSAAAAIPFAGWGATTIKAAKRTNDAVEAAVKSAKVSGKVAEAAAKGSRESAQAISRHADEAGGYILRRRMKEHEVPCFRKGKGNRASDIEYDRQLKAQQDALNQMSVGDYLKAREAYQRFGRHPDAAAEVAQFRDKFQAEQTTRLEKQKRNAGMTAIQARIEAAREAADMMKGLDALHTPDMVAGGYHSPTPTGRDMATTARNSTCSTDTWVTAPGSGEALTMAPIIEFPVEPWLASRKSDTRVPVASSAPVAQGKGSRRDRARRTTVVKAMSPTVVSR